MFANGCQCWVSPKPLPRPCALQQWACRHQGLTLPSTVRNPEGSICLYTKGADTVILERLHRKGIMEATTEEVLAVSVLLGEAGACACVCLHVHACVCMCLHDAER